MYDWVGMFIGSIYLITLQLNFHDIEDELAASGRVGTEQRYLVRTEVMAHYYDGWI